MEEEQDLKSVERELDHEWFEHRYKIGYGLDIYDLMRDVRGVMAKMPKDRPDELRDVLRELYKVLDAEQRDLVQVYGDEYKELLRARDELKELKKKKKKVKK